MFSSLSPIPSLLPYPGPHEVGTAEYEVAVADIPSESHVPDPAISTVKFRAFYPIVASGKAIVRNVTWLPQPQREWFGAYLDFLGAPPLLSKVLQYAPNPLQYATLRAGCNAFLLPDGNAKGRPVVMFSHGLGGSWNAYSQLLGSLASCGLVCFSLEHRDQTAPIAIIRQPDGKGMKTIEYKKLSHDPNEEVLKARNRQLRIRTWELELVYTVVSMMNKGEALINLAIGGQVPPLQGQLDLRPSQVSWVGHSFGAATMLQLVKSIYWHQSMPDATGQSPETSVSESLYTPADNSILKKQITARSPLVLLDLWTMPLRGDATRWLFERQLPCYVDDQASGSNVLTIMSEEFYNYKEIIGRVKAVLSNDPKKYEAGDVDRKGSVNQNQPRLFYIAQSAHLSQSDFALLYPWIAQKMLKTKDPNWILLQNTAAILRFLRERGIVVKGIDTSIATEPSAGDMNLSSLVQSDNFPGLEAIPID